MCWCLSRSYCFSLCPKFTAFLLSLLSLKQRAVPTGSVVGVFLKRLQYLQTPVGSQMSKYQQEIQTNLLQNTQNNNLILRSAFTGAFECVTKQWFEMVFSPLPALFCTFFFTLTCFRSVNTKEKPRLATPRPDLLNKAITKIEADTVTVGSRISKRKMSCDLKKLGESWETESLTSVSLQRVTSKPKSLGYGRTMIWNKSAGPSLDGPNINKKQYDAMWKTHCYSSYRTCRAAVLAAEGATTNY